MSIILDELIVLNKYHIGYLFKTIQTVYDIYLLRMKNFVNPTLRCNPPHITISKVLLPKISKLCWL